MKEGEKLIYENLFGGRETVSLVADLYEDTENLCLRLVSYIHGFPEPFATITVNVDAMPPYMAYIKDYSENQGMLEFITKNELGYLVLKKSDKIPFPVIQFHEEALRALNCEGLETYHQAVVANYYREIEYLDRKGSSAGIKYYTDIKDLHQEHKGRLDYGDLHKVLKYQPKSIDSRIKEATNKYGTAKQKKNAREKTMDTNHLR